MLNGLIKVKLNKQVLIISLRVKASETLQTIRTILSERYQGVQDQPQGPHPSISCTTP